LATTINVSAAHSARIFALEHGENKDSEMKRSKWVGTLAATTCLGFACSGSAAGAAAGTAAVHATPTSMAAASPGTVGARKCLADLHAFNLTITKDGYWLGGSRYGYGSPVSTSGYGWYGYPGDEYPAVASEGVRDARPGYEIRALLVSANILARHGQQQECEALLTTSRGIYQNYVGSLHGTTAPLARMNGWEQRQIASAQPVTGQNISFNSDQLVGTEVRNPEDEALGSVHDIVTSPQTGKIAYLVIGRGGVFGIDEKYVPVPWTDFKVTPNVSLLVLTATPSAMRAAPEVSSTQLNNGANFEEVSQTVDAYWKTSLSRADPE
jgi:sporulation protein YlmC with PRC-barrel domain